VRAPSPPAREPPSWRCASSSCPLPSSDVDRSKEFYVDRVGFGLDHDVSPGNGLRIVQLTPPGSACSVVLGVGIEIPASMRP
jgi:hypothetical protein